jgi:hypothetical protein
MVARSLNDMILVEGSRERFEADWGRVESKHEGSIEFWGRVSDTKVTRGGKGQDERQQRRHY